MRRLRERGIFVALSTHVANFSKSVQWFWTLNNGSSDVTVSINSGSMHRSPLAPHFQKRGSAKSKNTQWRGTEYGCARSIPSSLSLHSASYIIALTDIREVPFPPVDLSWCPVVILLKKLLLIIICCHVDKSCLKSLILKISPHALNEMNTKASLSPLKYAKRKKSLGTKPSDILSEVIDAEWGENTL